MRRPISAHAVTLCAALVFSPGTAFAARFCNTDDLAIPDGGTALNSVTVHAHFLTYDLNVQVQLEHDFVGDLVIGLEKVSGEGAPISLVTLMDRPLFPTFVDGCGGDDVDVVFDDESMVPVENQCAPSVAVQGTFQPNEALDAFDGVDMAGQYRLSVSDVSSEDAGTLLEWCLVYQPALDIDGDGVVGAFTDALLLLRYRIGFTGSVLTSGVVGEGCTRCTGDEIEEYLDGLP